MTSFATVVTVLNKALLRWGLEVSCSPSPGSTESVRLANQISDHVVVAINIPSEELSDIDLGMLALVELIGNYFIPGHRFTRNELCRIEREQRHIRMITNKLNDRVLRFYPDISVSDFLPSVPHAAESQPSKPVFVYPAPKKPDKTEKLGHCVMLRGPHLWRFIVGPGLGDRVAMATRLAQLAFDDDYPLSAKDAENATRAMKL